MIMRRYAPKFLNTLLLSLYFSFFPTMAKQNTEALSKEAENEGVSYEQFYRSGTAEETWYGGVEDITGPAKGLVIAGGKAFLIVGGKIVAQEITEEAAKKAVKQGEKVLNNTVKDALQVAHTPGLTPAAKEAGIKKALNPPPLPPAETGVKAWATKKWEGTKEYVGKKIDEWKPDRVAKPTTQLVESVDEVAKGVSVIGPRETYRQFAKDSGANFLNVTDDAWTWAKNEKFLAGIVKRGDDVVFPGKFDPNLLDKTSVLAREIKYLESHGYQWTSDFTKMILKK